MCVKRFSTFLTIHSKAKHLPSCKCNCQKLSCMINFWLVPILYIWTPVFYNAFSEHNKSGNWQQCSRMNKII